MNDFENNNQFSENFTDTSHQATPTYTTSYAEYKAQKKANKPKKKHSTAVVIIAALLAAIIGASSGILSMAAILGVNWLLTDETPTQAVNGGAQIDNGSSNNITIKVNENAASIAEAVAAKCTNSVVGIRTTTSVSGFFGGTQEQSGDGSGVIYTSDGYIITNYHVIGDAVSGQNSKIDVFIGNDKTKSYPASVVGYNISCDLAVIKINAQGLTPMEIGDSSALNIGQYVVTIGSPGGLEFMGSVTYGIISGLDRTVSTNSTLKLIQTDAAINPGNSGGALLNVEGKLIGINSSKIASVEYEGMGFAIPVNTVKETCDKIISREGSSQAYFGVSISSTYTSDVLKLYGYPAGAVVSSVASGSPASKAGIARGDIITKFNGVEISEYTVLGDAMYDCQPNQTVEVVVYRSGKYYTINVTLASDTTAN